MSKIIVGYSRASRKGQHIFVSGITATDKLGMIVGLNNPYAQTIQAIRNIEKVLNEPDASLNDVVRTSIDLSNIFYR
jgi:enamine deaminase RidA (YjgF/YER057c/UK114 family)